VDSIRLSLAVPLTIRNENNLDKDALLRNAFIEISQSGTGFAVKRAGYSLGTNSIMVGTNRGIFYNPNDGVNYYVDSTNNIHALGF